MKTLILFLFILFAGADATCTNGKIWDGNKCTCDWDTTYNNGTDCVSLSDCVPGEFIHTEKKPWADRVCEICPRGGFTNDFNMPSCTPWKQCARLKTQGTITTDAVCGFESSASHVEQNVHYPVVAARDPVSKKCHPGAHCNHVDNICKFTKNSLRCAYEHYKCSIFPQCGQNFVCWELQNKFKDITWAGLSIERCELETCLHPHSVCCEALTSTCEACKRCMTEEDYCLLPIDVRKLKDGFVPPGCTCPPGSYSENGDGFSPCLPCIIGEGNEGGNDPCGPCAAGTVNPNPGSPCLECPYPYYQPALGMTECIEGTVLECEVGQGWTPPSTTAEGSCADCTPGTYAPNTTTIGCIECPAGRHQAESKQSSCDRCPDDTTSVASSDGDEDCTACTIDQDCRVRTTVNGKECKREAPDNLGCRSKTEAKDGKNWCETTDGGEDYCVVACPPGYEPVLNADKGVAFYECSACAAGKASPGYDDAVCSVCDAGNYTADGTECTACSMEGVQTWVSTFTGWTSDDNCIAVNCDAGYRHRGDTNKCIACPGGEWSAADSTECTPDTIDLNDCGGNQHFVEGTDNTQDDAGCVDDDIQQSDCIAGQYYIAGQNNVANDSSCGNCTANQHSDAGAAACTDDTYSVHTDCDAGTFFVVGTDNTQDDGACTACSEPSAAQYVTVVCSTDADTTLASCTGPSSDGGDYISQACSKGSSTAVGSDTTRTSCGSCVAGEYISSACDDGDINIAGTDTVCTNCDAGTYSDAADQTSCKDCTAGTSYSAAGATSCTSCSDPADGMYVSSTCTVTADTETSACAEAGSGQYQATACAQGTPGSTGSAGTTQSCSGNCAAGKKQTNCVQGDWETQGSDRSCTACDANTYSSSGDTTCTNCAANTESASGDATCTACAAGKSSTSGQACSNCDAGKTSTSGNACSSCAAGTYSAAGDASCTTCENGKYSAAGASSCTAHTSCGDQTDNSNRLTGESATAAGSCETCDDGSFAADATSNCQSYSTSCTGDKYKSADGTTTADITCTACTTCTAGTDYQTTACTFTSNRVCTAVDTCTDGTNYQTTAPTTTQNRVCTTCSSCGNGKKITGGCSGTNDRTCGDCTNPTCQLGSTFYTPCDGSTTTDPTCTACTTCGEEGEASACTLTSDTVCNN